MSDYAPAVDANGVEHYGEAHARRQADAEAAMEGLWEVMSTPPMQVRCPKNHSLATVHKTGVGPVIVIRPYTNPNTPDLKDLRREHSVVVSRSGSVFADPLLAPDDRDLESRCRCGFKDLNRERIAADWAGEQRESKSD